MEHRVMPKGLEGLFCGGRSREHVPYEFVVGGSSDIHVASMCSVSGSGSAGRVEGWRMRRRTRPLEELIFGNPIPKWFQAGLF